MGAMDELSHDVVVSHLESLEQAASDERFTMDWDEAHMLKLWLEDHDANLRAERDALAAEVERVKRLEAESEAARAFRNEYHKDFGAWQDLRDDLFKLLDESDEDAALAELDAGEGPC